MSKVNNKDTGTTPTSFWCLYCQFWTFSTPYASVSIVNFKQVNADWVRNLSNTYNRAASRK